MERLSIIPDELDSLRISGQEELPEILLEGRKHLQENFLPVLSKLTEMAKDGNLQAAKLLYPDISRLMSIDEEGVDIMDELGSEPDEDW